MFQTVKNWTIPIRLSRSNSFGDMPKLPICCVAEIQTTDHSRYGPHFLVVHSLPPDADSELLQPLVCHSPPSEKVKLSRGKWEGMGTGYKLQTKQWQKLLENKLHHCHEQNLMEGNQVCGQEGEQSKKSPDKAGHTLCNLSLFLINEPQDSLYSLAEFHLCPAWFAVKCRRERGPIIRSQTAVGWSDVFLAF